MRLPWPVTCPQWPGSTAAASPFLGHTALAIEKLPESLQEVTPALTGFLYRLPGKLQLSHASLRDGEVKSHGVN